MRCVNRALNRLWANGTIKGPEDGGSRAAGAPTSGSALTGNRGSRILGSASTGGGGRSVAIAVVCDARLRRRCIVLARRQRRPAGPTSSRRSSTAEVFEESFPDIARAFSINVKIFLIAEVFILVFALVIAVLAWPAGAGLLPDPGARDGLRRTSSAASRRSSSSTSSASASRRSSSPACRSIRSSGASSRSSSSTRRTSPRCTGPESSRCIPSQEAAARSLGLITCQALRFVVLPQAVRRVIPPLLNDFIGLQKDTALVGLLGVVEAFRQSQIDVAATFNYTPYICDGDPLHRSSRSRWRGSPTGSSRATSAATARREARVNATGSCARPRGRPQVVRQASRCCAGSTSRSPSTRSCA